MDDMTAFERQLGAGFKGLMGPSAPVDDAAIFTAITTTQSPKWKVRPMVSVTRFAATALSVALFGGFLLASALTTPTEDARPPVGATSTPESTTTPPIQLPAEIPDGVVSGTLHTPVGQARWIHLSGDATTLPSPPWWAGSGVHTPDGFVVVESSGTPAKLWRSPDLISWTWQPLDIDAGAGQLTYADGTYWLTANSPAGLWRSRDTTSWQRIDLDGLARPGPEGYVWDLELGEASAYGGAAIVPFSWWPDHGVVTRRLPGAESLRGPRLRQIEPGVYGLFAIQSDVVHATVRFEETANGVRVIDAADGAALTVIDGVSLEFIERSSSGDIPEVDGLGILADDALVEVGYPGDTDTEARQAFSVDSAGFVAYVLGADGFVHVHRSQDGRDWDETSVIGDDPGEPTDIQGVNAERGSVSIGNDSTTWTTADGGFWAIREELDLDYPMGSGSIEGLLGSGGNPDSGDMEIAAGNVRARMYYQSEAGVRIPINITAMAVPATVCSESQGMLSANTLIGSVESCDGLRDIWIATFDDVPG